MSRICMLVRGDAQRLPPSRYFAEALARRGHVVDFYHTSRSGELERFVGSVRYLHLPFSPDSVPRVLRPASEISWGSRFIAESFRIQYDLFVAHNSSAIPWVAAASRLASRPWIYHAHELFLFWESSAIAKGYRLAELSMARGASAVVCPEPHRATILRQHARLKREPFLVRNAMPLKPRLDSRELRDYVAARGGPAGRIVLYQGGISLSRSFGALLKSVVHWPPEDCLVLLGWGSADELQQVDSLSAELGIASRVFRHPPVSHDKLWPLLCSADLGLILYEGANLNETFAAPNKLGEYLMAGLAVAYLPCDGVHSLLSNEPFAAQAKDATPMGIANAITTLLIHNLEEAKSHARAYAESTYNYENLSRDMIDAVEKMANSGCCDGT